MKLLLCCLILLSALSLLEAANTAPVLSTQEQVELANQRRRLTLEEREVEYHKQLHQAQEKKVAAMRRPQGAYRDTSTNQDDYDALVALYRSTDGAKWANNTGWMKGDPCTYPYWFGIYCLNDRVLQINLVYNLLSGPLPSALEKASALQVIRLYSNTITGELSPGIFTIKSLKVLDVNTNQMTGTLPARVDLANLTELVLYGNNFKGAFPNTFHAPKLQLLEISSNSLSGNLPEGLSESTGLTQLVVSRNSFTGVLPESYGNLVELQRLWTFYNNFDRPTLPDSYQRLVELVEVQADGLSGQMPDWIGSSWSKIQNLVLINGQLSGGFPQSLCNCKEMISLRVFNNSLKGELPDCVCEMQKMTDFEISDNQFTGSIPDNFQGCKNLVTMYLSRNNFTGTFPGSVSGLVNLTVVDVSNNGLYGTIPNSINNLKDSIAEFAICYNMFSDVESGMDDFFKRIVDYSCLFYNNPWSCPMSTVVPKECTARCSTCNVQAQHQSCSACVPASGCGWCQKGQNCLEGSSQGPGTYYKCMPEDWKVGSC